MEFHCDKVNFYDVFRVVGSFNSKTADCISSAINSCHVSYILLPLCDCSRRLPFMLFSLAFVKKALFLFKYLVGTED